METQSNMSPLVVVILKRLLTERPDFASQVSTLLTPVPNDYTLTLDDFQVITDMKTLVEAL